jgi:hypothetical protein
LIKNSKNYNFIIEQILKFKTLSQCVCINVYMQSVVPTIWTPNVFRLKSVEYESCLEFQNLQLRIHCTCNLDTKTSLRQKSFEYTKLLKISKSKVLLYNKNLNSKRFILATILRQLPMKISLHWHFTPMHSNWIRTESNTDSTIYHI